MACGAARRGQIRRRAGRLRRGGAALVRCFRRGGSDAAVVGAGRHCCCRMAVLAHPWADSAVSSTRWCWVSGPAVTRPVGRCCGGWPPPCPVDEVVPALAETAGRTMHSTRAEVRLLMSDGDSWSQVWPQRAVADGSQMTVGVRHGGTDVGEIEVDVADPDESDRDRGLLDDLARPAGLALSTVRLTVELRRRAADLEEVDGGARQVESPDHGCPAHRARPDGRRDAGSGDATSGSGGIRLRSGLPNSGRHDLLARRRRRNAGPTGLGRCVGRRRVGYRTVGSRARMSPLRWMPCEFSPAGSTRRGWPTPASPSRWRAGSSGRASRST